MHSVCLDPVIWRINPVPFPRLQERKSHHPCVVNKWVTMRLLAAPASTCSHRHPCPNVLLGLIYICVSSMLTQLITKPHQGKGRAGIRLNRSAQDKMLPHKHDRFKTRSVGEKMCINLNPRKEVCWKSKYFTFGLLYECSDPPFPMLSSAQSGATELINNV